MDQLERAAFKDAEGDRLVIVNPDFTGTVELRVLDGVQDAYITVEFTSSDEIDEFIAQLEAARMMLLEYGPGFVGADENE